MLRGIDISKWQGDIDFKKVKDSGIDFLILREGYRQQVDPKFYEYVDRAKSVGLKILGVYHFMYSESVADAEEEALSCRENLFAAGLGRDIIVFSDFEYDTVKKAAANGVNLTKADCNLHTDAFCMKISEGGYVPGIYTNLDFYKNWYKPEILKKYMIWLADYTGGPDFDCVMQQYTSKGVVPGISGFVDMNYYYGNFKMDNNDRKFMRSKVVDLARSWVGKNESDGSYREIIDIYNSYTGKFPRGVKMQYDWPWCACTVSALAIALGYDEIMPLEISCSELIKRAQEMDIWVEDDSYRPLPGDEIVYDWDDNGVGDNVGHPDHVGVVEEVRSDGFMVIEGNKSDAVGRRFVAFDGKYIRGFITPKYSDENNVYGPYKTPEQLALEVLDRKWGNGQARKDALEAAGYDYAAVQAEVNRIVIERRKEKLLFIACRAILGEYGLNENVKEALEKESLSAYETDVKDLISEIRELSRSKG